MCATFPQTNRYSLSFSLPLNPSNTQRSKSVHRNTQDQWKTSWLTLYIFPQAVNLFPQYHTWRAELFCPVFFSVIVPEEEWRLVWEGLTAHLQPGHLLKIKVSYTRHLQYKDIGHKMSEVCGGGGKWVKMIITVRLTKVLSASKSSWLHSTRRLRESSGKAARTQTRFVSHKDASLHTRTHDCRCLTLQGADQQVGSDQERGRAQSDIRSLIGYTLAEKVH